MLTVAWAGAAFALSLYTHPTGQPSEQPTVQPTGRPSAKPLAIVELATLEASDGATDDQFGGAVATAGGVVAVGTPRVNAFTGRPCDISYSSAY